MQEIEEFCSKYGLIKLSTDLTRITEFELYEVETKDQLKTTFLLKKVQICSLFNSNAQEIEDYLKKEVLLKHNTT